MHFETLQRSRWTVPAFSACLGLMLLVASTLGGHLTDGLLMFGVMTAFGVAILLSGRSETIRGLRGDGRDERFMQMDLKATACAGIVVILA